MFAVVRLADVRAWSRIWVCGLYTECPVSIYINFKAFAIYVLSGQKKELTHVRGVCESRYF